MIDKKFPLCDLHRHLDGSVRLETILELGRKHNLPLPAWDIEGIRPHVQVMKKQPGVMAFLSKFEWMTRILVDYEAVWRVAYENVLDTKKEGLDYVELRFSPWFMSEMHGLDPAAVVEAAAAGASTGEAETEVKVNLIGIISRTYGPEAAWKELNALLHHKDCLVAIDLAGDEANYPAHLFTDHFTQARNAGWQVTIHAGESSGPESVWDALKFLGAVRLGHAVHAQEDPVLMDYIYLNQIGIEANLTSNVQTSTVSDYANHPLRLFLERGLLATINTDDPGISGIDLAHEYEMAAPAAGLSLEQIQQAQRNALTIAFLSTEEKQILLDKKASSRSAEKGAAL
jgi:adenosine deaminase